MTTIDFPDPRSASEDGVVYIGGELTPENVMLAYEHGIFPWPVQEGLPVIWACPQERGIIEFDKLHVPRSLRKEREKTTFTFTIDRDFPTVIRACAFATRPDQDGTWITSAMGRTYIELHNRGHAHSVEVWDGDELVGGLYGVDAGGVFAGESMFHRRSNASKMALLYLIDVLKERGAAWLDIQVMTPHMEILGAFPIPREEFLKKLAATRRLGIKLFEQTTA